MDHKIVVVENDPLVGNLTRDLLVDAGFDVELVQEALKAQEVIRRLNPAAAVLDILMPGLDGLALCHQLKNDPQTKDIRIIMVSGKAFHADRQRAKDYGAELFIEKPYNVEKFAQQVKDLLASPLSARAAEPRPIELGSPTGTLMTATVWGCRSLSPEKRGEKSQYGRATSCVSLEVGKELLIFDAGSGLGSLSAQIQKDGRYKTLWLFLTHFHQDHVEGLGGFSCLRAPGFTLNVGAISDPDKSLADKIAEIFDAAPGKYGPVTAPIELYEMTEGTYEILPGIQVASFFANHPGTTLGFKVQTGGRKFVYCPDSELYGERGTALQDYDEELGALCAGADLFIHDARYTEEDYRTRLNNGHSSWRNAVEFAGRNKIKRLVLTHHDDQYSDAVIGGIAAAAARLVAEKGYPLELFMAAEGLKISL